MSTSERPPRCASRVSSNASTAVSTATQASRPAWATRSTDSTKRSSVIARPWVTRSHDAVRARLSDANDLAPEREQGDRDHLEVGHTQRDTDDGDAKQDP